jgi:hypothetical protein
LIFKGFEMYKYLLVTFILCAVVTGSPGIAVIPELQGGNLTEIRGSLPDAPLTYSEPLTSDGEKFLLIARDSEEESQDKDDKEKDEKEDGPEGFDRLWDAAQFG